MNRKIMVIFLFIFISIKIYSQQTFLYYDTLTYRLYNQNQWDSVIFHGKNAINQGIDYYYLRMRIGIAYYSLKQYSQALEHFFKAKEYNSNDIVNEYIYYSYLYSGQIRKAYYFTKEMNHASVKKNGLTQPHFIDLFGIEMNLAQFDNWNSIKITNKPPSEPNNYRLEKELSGPFISYGINTSLNLSQKWSWQQQFSYFKVNSYQQLFFDNSIKHESDFHLFEKHYFSSFSNWNQNKVVSFFTHLSILNADKFQYQYLNAVIAPPPFPPITTYNYKIEPIRYYIFNYIFGIQKTRYASKSSFTYMLNISKIIDHNVFTGGLGFFYHFNSYLFGKSNVLASINLSHKDFDGYYEQQLGAILLKKITLSVNFDLGKIQNITNLDGSIVYNTPYIIQTKISPHLSISFNRHLTLQAAYIYQISSFTNTFVGFDGFSKQGQIRYKDFFETYKFNNQIITGGILWKF
ncbi:MAG: hypothetical protein HPY79_09710 [Bacteroidales bacterium]|nr:hypothetical protein [Bacteroidales bacterium]